MRNTTNVYRFKGGPLSIESDYIEIKREQPIIWRSSQQTTNFSNDPNTICRNSVQGKILIVDDRGLVCQRSDLQSTGCCDFDAVNSKLHSCETCNLSGCCTIYEYCVSCCLNPDKVIRVAMSQIDWVSTNAFLYVNYRRSFLSKLSKKRVVVRKPFLHQSKIILNCA